MPTGDANPNSESESLERRIRARGPVLDMPFVHSIYKPLLEKQSRVGVVVTRDVAYGPDPLHLAAVFGFSTKTAIRYASTARHLLQARAETTQLSAPGNP